MKRFLGLLLLVLAVACGDDSAPADGGALADTSVAADGALPDGARPDGGVLCVDADEDGYGEGCEAGPDCDDTDAAIHPSALELCNNTDDDCDDVTDEEFERTLCPLAEGVCAGSVASCAVGLLTCGPAEYGAEFEMAETLCDGLDNDCDGDLDEDCTCADGEVQACGLEEGACMPGTQTCVDGGWGECADVVGPMGESCNGIDDDCDGLEDEASDLEAPNCPLSQGVCTGSKRRCGGVAGFIACRGVESYGGDYEATETACDGLDNDCDGVEDEGCSCIDGTIQSCGSDVGVCAPGTQTCIGGAFGECSDTGPATETCDGEDEDCDRRVDEDLSASLCPLTRGVCLGATRTCDGASGFGACTPGSYGPNYEEDETRCDGRDNDCDGMTDEDCDCLDGTRQSCGTSVGRCERGFQECVGGSFGACQGGVTPTTEICNGFDDNCNGATDEDFVCDLPPEATDALCDDGIDNDDDGFTDCEDWSCTRSPDVTVCGSEDTVGACTDGVDNDGDGFIDCQDWDCSFNPLVLVCDELNDFMCSDGLDNDDNGFTDCDDFTCQDPAITVCP